MLYRIIDIFVLVNDVNGPLLLTEINEEVLRESIIVESWGLRKRILKEINDLLKQYRACFLDIICGPLFPTCTNVPYEIQLPRHQKEIKLQL